VTGTEGIVFALFSFAKAGEATQLTEGRESVPPSGQNLVGVALVGNVPNNIVRGHVEDVVQGNRELGNPKGWTEVASRLGDVFYDLPSELVGQLKLIHVVDAWSMYVRFWYWKKCFQYSHGIESRININDDSIIRMKRN
jgi:hypothetical protein